MKSMSQIIKSIKDKSMSQKSTNAKTQIDGKNLPCYFFVFHLTAYHRKHIQRRVKKKVWTNTITKIVTISLHSLDGTFLQLENSVLDTC